MRYARSMFIVVLLCAIQFACQKHTGSFPPPEEMFREDNVSGAIHKESFKRGRALAATECADCHRFYSPREYSPAEWERIIRRKAKRLSLGQEQMADINLYFQTASKTAP